MNSSRFLHTLALAVFSIVGILSTETSHAQTPPEAGAARPPSKEARQRALELLDMAIPQIPNLKSVENRLLLKLMAADLLWEEDEKRARSLYEEVASDFLGYAAEQSAQRLTNDASGSGAARTLQNIIESMAKHDLRLALEFSRSSGAQGSAKRGRAAGLRIYTRDLELRLALQIISKDPKQALDIARQSMDKGVSYALQDFILELAKKDPEAAAAFVREVETKISEEGFGSPESLAVALSLIRLGGTFTSPEGELGGRTDPAPCPVVTRKTIQNLLTRLISKALSLSGDESELLSALQSVAAEIQKYAPERYQLLQKKFGRLNADVTTSALNEYQQLIQEGSVGELLSAIQRAPADARDSLYQQAAWKALGEGDIDRARQIAADFIPDARERDQILSQADRHSLQRVVGQGKISQLRRVLPGLKTDEERVGALVQCATALAEKNNKEAALQLLNEAHDLIHNPVRNAAQLDAQIQLAHAYLRVDPEQSFKMMAQIIDQTNRLVTAAAVLDGFINPEEAFADEELLLRTDSGVVNAIFFRCAAELAALARVDLDRAQDLVDKLENRETALAARMLLAQDLLSSSPTGKYQPRNR